MNIKTPKYSGKKEIIKIRSQINEKEMNEMIGNINKTKSRFLEKINKINKPLARLIKKKNRGPKSIKSGMKKEKLQLIPQKHKGYKRVL